MKKENTYTEMGTNIRGYKIYYKGCSPFKDTVKIGIASILVGSGGYCAYRSIKNNKDNNVPLYLLVAVGVSIFIQDFLIRTVESKMWRILKVKSRVLRMNQKKNSNSGKMEGL